MEIIFKGKLQFIVSCLQADLLFWVYSVNHLWWFLRFSYLNEIEEEASGKAKTTKEYMACYV